MPILRTEEEVKVREWFGGLARPVELFVALGPEETPRAGSADLDFGAEMVRMCEGLAELGDGVTCRVEDEPEGFLRFPAVSIRPEGQDAGLRYDGLPWGYELSSLVGGIVDAGREEPKLRPDSLATLEQLDRDIALEVFVTPTCPHCPPVVLLAYRCALASERVTAAAIEANEFPQVSQELGVRSVPRIVVDGEPCWDGSVPEAEFVRRILAAA
jgi:glutaredoxin-like protein